MGRDIHMFVVNKDSHKIIIDDLYDGRNSNWFDNISCRDKGDDEAYDHLYVNYDLPEHFVEANNKEYIVKNEDGTNYTGYFDFTYITVEKFLKWFYKYRPDVFAGWVTRYEAWNWEKRHILPNEFGDHYIKRTLDKDDVLQDYVFMEFEDDWDPSRNIAKMLEEAVSNNRITGDDLLVWYFDW